jgi:hypothetical protein
MCRQHFSTCPASISFKFYSSCIDFSQSLLVLVITSRQAEFSISESVCLSPSHQIIERKIRNMIRKTTTIYVTHANKWCDTTSDFFVRAEYATRTISENQYVCRTSNRHNQPLKKTRDGQKPMISLLWFHVAFKTLKYNKKFVNIY